MSTFLIIAASSTIGQNTVKQLKGLGHRVITTARDTSKIQPDFILDASDFDAVENVFEQVGQLEGVVNCAGSLLLKPAHQTSYDQYKSVVDQSLTTAFACVRGAGKYMKNGGSVVLISSAAALEGIVNHEAIASAKAGIIGLALSAAATYAPKNLRFNVIAPGLVETSLTESLFENQASRKISESMHALNRLGSPEDIANAIVFLLDPRNSWITGQVLAIDGGLSRVRPKLKMP
jgi:NAD(P)-dependent dehydrogenase (short-subunit alcohol dehydrogenase family)